jgi:uncharacterized protein (DUF488 family)
MAGTRARFFTIGIYQTTAESFFESLRRNKITHFCDIRQRRGLRGSKYKYGNSEELQGRLSKLGIEYRHVTELAPTEEIRQVQMAADKKAGITGTSREQISPEYAAVYKKYVHGYDFKAFVESFPADAKVVIFCVEHSARACHRSIVAEHLAQRLDAEVKDITPG